MSAATANLTVAAALLLAGLSILLTIVAVASYARTKSPRLAWISAAFVAFAIQGVYLTVLSYKERGEIARGLGGPVPMLIALDLAIVAFLYLAVLKR